MSVMSVYCGQTVGWIKMPLGMEVGLGPGYIVLDGDPAPLRKGAQQRSPPPTFRPMSTVAKWSPVSDSVTAELLLGLLMHHKRLADGLSRTISDSL